MAEVDRWQETVEQILRYAVGDEARVDFFYPETWNEKPTIVTFRLAGQRDLRADDTLYGRIVTIYIDVWSRDPATVDDVASRCQSALEENGWFYDGFSNDLFEQESRWYHRVERYRND